MKNAALERLAPLLETLRAHPALREVRPATFDLDGRSFVHFHEEHDGLFADVLLATGRVHLPVSSDDEQAELLERVQPVLDALEMRQLSRERRQRRDQQADKHPRP